MRKKGGICILLGAVFLIAAAGVAVLNHIAENAAESAADQTARLLMHRDAEQGQNTADDPFSPAGDSGEELIPDYILDPERDMPAVEIDERDYVALLEIPTLSLSLPILEQWSYAGLKVAPGRYSGSLYTNDMVIAGHNYASHFGSIKQLSQGDQVFVTDMDGNIFPYEVLGTETLRSDDIDNMIHGEWDLTLFTCTVGGLQRISVRCRLSAGDSRFTY